MGVPVKELMGRIDSDEFTYWIAFYNIEPFGPMQEDLRAGYATSILYNVNRAEKSQAKSPGDFFHSLKQEKSFWDTPEGQDKLGRIWAAIFSGRHRKA